MRGKRGVQKCVCFLSVADRVIRVPVGSSSAGLGAVVADVKPRGWLEHHSWDSRAQQRSAPAHPALSAAAFEPEQSQAVLFSIHLP